MEIYYEEYGQGTPLVMILGLGQDTATWSFQIPELSNRLRLIVFDNRDCGKSSRCLDGYTTRTMAQDTIGLMDHLGIAQAHICGTSMGGMIAQQVVLMAPERVKGLILASTTCWGEA